MLHSFETRVQHRRLGSKIEAKFRSFWPHKIRGCVDIMSKAPSTPATCRSNMSNSTCRSNMSNVASTCRMLPFLATCRTIFSSFRHVETNWTSSISFDMSNVECHKLPVASTCCLLPFNMLLRHVAGVDGALVFVPDLGPTSDRLLTGADRPA